MKQIIIPEKRFNVYSFDELSDEAKEIALKNWQEYLLQYGYFWEEELLESLKTIGELFNVTFEIERYTGDICVESYPEFSEEMNFKRSIAFINNHFNFYDISYKLKEKLKRIKGKNNYNIYFKLFYNQTYKNLPKKYLEDVLLTGYCDDYILQDTYKKFIDTQRKRDKYNASEDVKNDLYYQRRKKSFNLTLYDFFTMLADTAQEVRDNEREYQESEEYFKEHADINEYLFYENGEKYN